MTIISRTLRVLVTLLIVAIALFVLVQVWKVYIVAPWTRDGRVFAQTIIVAPEVSGTVVAMPLTDNQIVHQGDILFRIDPIRFKIAVAQSQARLDQAKITLRQRQQDEARRAGLKGLVSAEDRQNASLAVQTAAAAVQGAQAALDLAKLNLARTIIHAPTTGYITHLRLQTGDFATAGTPVVTVLDSASFRVIAYYEETKLAKITPGAPVTIKLMGYNQRLTGHVRTIGRGIADQNDATNKLGLPTVNPVFNWVRLAQRIPVDIAIDHIPPTITLAAGMTCSVDITHRHHHNTGPAARVRRWLEGTL